MLLDNVWCGRRDLNSRTVSDNGLPGRWLGRPIDALSNVLDQARLRPHGPPPSSTRFFYLTITRKPIKSHSHIASEKPGRMKKYPRRSIGQHSFPMVA